MLLELGHDRGFLVSSPRGPFRYNLRFLPLRAPVGIVSPGYLGVLDEFPYWNAVFDLYRKDRLDEALLVMKDLGIGMYGDYGMAGDFIYLEGITSDESEIIRLGDRLEMEVIRGQLPFPYEELTLLANATYDEVRLIGGGALEKTDTCITVLVKGGEIPGASWRDGYYTPKEPYGKICLPMPGVLPKVMTGMKRGLAYNLAFQIAGGQASLWLLEAFASVVTGSTGSHPPMWLSPDQLDVALIEMDDSDEAIARLAYARAQSAAVGKYLSGHGGVDGILHCLSLHRPSRTPSIATRHAVEKAYSMSPKELYVATRR